MATIVSETFRDGVQRGLCLGNDEFSRTLSLTPWNNLLVGMMISFDVRTTGTTIYNGSFRVGLSPSQTDNVGDGDVTFYFGAMTGRINTSIDGGQFTYTDAGGFPVYQAGGGMTRHAIVSNKFTASNNAVTVTFPVHTGSAEVLRKWPLVIRFAKSGANLIITPYIFSSVTAPTSGYYFSTQNFLDMMDATTVSSTPQISGSNLTGTGGTTLAYDIMTGSYGVIDTLHIGWNKSDVKAYIWDLAIQRKA